MRLLDRYLLRELLAPLGYCLAGVLVFWISFDLLGELDGFQARGLQPLDIAEYYLVKLPELLVTVTPLTFLLALLYALTHHARHQELTAMRAAGLSLGRIAVPYLAVGGLLSLGLLALNEFCVPEANDAAARVLQRREAPGGAADPQWQRSLAFHNERDQRLWNIGAYRRGTGAMVAPAVEWRDAEGCRRQLWAERAEYTNGGWVFFEVREMLYRPGADSLPVPGRTNRLELPEFSETPAQIDSEIRFTELSNVRAAKRPHLSLREVLNYRRLHPHLNAPARAKLETQLHGRLAEPWTCLVVVLIALPFGAPSGRRNVFAGVAVSIFLGFAYFILLRLGLTLGTGGYLEPWVAAWAPNVCFSLAGLVLARRVR